MGLFKKKEKAPAIEPFEERCELFTEFVLNLTGIVWKQIECFQKNQQQHPNRYDEPITPYDKLSFQIAATLDNHALQALLFLFVHASEVHLLFPVRYQWTGNFTSMLERTFAPEGLDPASFRATRKLGYRETPDEFLDECLAFVDKHLDEYESIKKRYSGKKQDKVLFGFLRQRLDELYTGHDVDIEFYKKAVPEIFAKI